MTDASVLYEHGHLGEDPRYPVTDWKHEVANDQTVLGYWEWAGEPTPGPTHDVWIAEPDHWAWQSCGMTFTCDDDPDGKGARASAHDYARHLRQTYPCAFVAVRQASKGLPRPIRLTP
jgi:hypothetical protein